MQRQVRGEDGRRWILRARLEWRNPADEGFEHDVTGGRGPGAFMLVVVLFLVLALALWQPVGLVVPTWLVLAFLLLVMFFPLRWMFRRPWTVVAETPDVTEEHPDPEHWVGPVRGYFATRDEMAGVTKSLRRHGTPGADPRTPLSPVS